MSKSIIHKILEKYPELLQEKKIQLMLDKVRIHESKKKRKANDYDLGVRAYF